MKSGVEISLVLNTMSGTTSLTETDLTKLVPSSAGTWEDALYVLRITGTAIPGLKILDVGGGASEITSRFLEMRGDAYSVDPRYKNRSDLIGHVRQTLKAPHYNREQIRDKSRSLGRFSSSIRISPERYKTAPATSIPFPDNFFDLVFSINAVMPYLDVDRRILVRTTVECLRVLKSGGVLQFFPYDEYVESWPEAVNDQRRKNDAYLLSWARAKNMVSSATVENIRETPGGRERLVIVKTVGDDELPKSDVG